MPDVTTSHPSNSQAFTVCHTAHFATRWLHTSTAIVTAHGEIDAANVIDFVDYALRSADRMTKLVIDLTGVEFFGSVGFSALQTLNVRCADAGITLGIATSKAVNRLLRICDPDMALPVSPGVETALSAVTGEPRRLLKLVAEPS
jgi:anti-anti-sigma factor